MDRLQKSVSRPESVGSVHPQSIIRAIGEIRVAHSGKVLAHFERL